MNKIVIIIRGGCVQSVYSQDNAKVEIIDCDDLSELTGAESVRETINEAKEGLRKVY